MRTETSGQQMKEIIEYGRRVMVVIRALEASRSTNLSVEKST